MASNQEGLTDEDEETSDWIELHNPTTTPLDLSEWTLTDSLEDPTKWTFPSITLEPDSYLIIFASGKNRTNPVSELHTNFKLSKNGETLALITPQGEIASAYDFPPQVDDFSYGLTPANNSLFLISDSSPVNVLVPSAETDVLIGSTWKKLSFDDSTWRSGNLGVGFERGSGFENEIRLDLETEAWGVNSTCYLRVPFLINSDLSSIQSLTLSMKYDDGFIAYLNGEAIASENAPLEPLWNSNATTSRADSLAVQYQDFDLSDSLDLLNSGENLLAIHGLNQFANSGDFLISAQLVATLSNDQNSTVGFFSSPTPGRENPKTNTSEPIGAPSGKVTISEKSGVKTSPISVSLTAQNPGEIRFTLDGSEPNTNSLLYTTPLNISEPTQLRARAYEPNRAAGPIIGEDFSFIDSSLLNYLSEIPVLVMDNFGGGAYPNKGRSNDGRDIRQVARQTNVMSIFEPDQSGKPFAQNASLESLSGCRVRGSSSSQFSRKPLSVEFWNHDQSERKLSPFGMPEEADWVLYPPNPSYDRALIHNPVSFGFAKLIGALAPDAKVIAVFQNTSGGTVNINHLEGIYLFSEKIERGRAGADFRKFNESASDGGWMINIDRMAAIPEDLPLDTIQPNFHAAGPNGILQIPDDEQNSGGSQVVDDISEYYHSYLNFHHPDGYTINAAQRAEVQSEIRAMDSAVWSPSFADPNLGYQTLLDAESWALNFCVHNFAKNQDAHVLSTYLYKEQPSSLIKMGPVWDFDRAYTWNGSASSSPLWASDRDWYQGLFRDINFRQLHQDIWQTKRLNTITDEVLEILIDKASIGINEGQVSASGISFSSWNNRIAELRSWMKDRAHYLDSQYEPLPLLLPAQREFIDSTQVELQASQGGLIYYTSDGTDPRALNGAISPNATLYTEPFTLDSRTQIIARTKDGSRWSGPVDQHFYQVAKLPQIAVTEIHYHPLPPTPTEESQGFTEEKDFEFIEIMNVGLEEVELSNLRISGGISFSFPVMTLSVGERVIICSNLDAFRSRYGTSHQVAGEFSGALANSGDHFLIEDRLLNLELLSASYLDSYPWPPCADGEGYSLILKHPQPKIDHHDPGQWRCSTLPGGNPGSSDSLPAYQGNPQQDLDGDGLTSLVEAFLGTSDSISQDGSHSYQLNFLNAEDLQDYPIFEITYPIGADDLTYDVYWSKTLHNWSNSEDVRTLVHESPNGDGTMTSVWRSTTRTEASPQFFRLQVRQK